MSNLSKKEQKRIQKYCVFPKISRVAIIMSFVLCGLIVVLEGELKGRTEGRIKERHDMIKNALLRGTTPEQLIHLMGFEKAEILACQKELEDTK